MPESILTGASGLDGLCLIFVESAASCRLSVLLIVADWVAAGVQSLRVASNRLRLAVDPAFRTRFAIPLRRCVLRTVFLTIVEASAVASLFAFRRWSHFQRSTKGPGYDAVP